MILRSKAVIPIFPQLGGSKRRTISLAGFTGLIRTMLDHMILTVSNVERSLASYEAALKPLNSQFFLPFKGEGDHSDLWGFGEGKRAIELADCHVFSLPIEILGC
jgi:hypothetical protein